MPSVTGPYTTVSCTLSLLKSSIRTSPLLSDEGYARGGSEDARFVDYYGTVQQIVTSSGSNDSGLFEVNLRDERFLPFEGAGAISTWKLELPAAFRQFDYNTIQDVILHMRYTARQAGGLLGQGAVAGIEDLVGQANSSGMALLLSLPHEFPSEWHKFTAPGSTADFKAIVKRDYFPYLTQGKTITIDAVQLHNIEELQPTAPQKLASQPIEDANTELADTGEFWVSFAEGQVLERRKDAQIFALIKYSLSSP